ncbi:hypothetical protein D9611_007907 [Ephemerocybe angulata]|uniref:Uncharacterized protein n=1 Tax=Ephemerocybe angulata TaxID=980116 RepID=A0A8H5FKW1_9AGAR|nr:hypothetical protein D9611_007907 [Tulosesus angulatus]
MKKRKRLNSETSSNIHGLSMFSQASDFVIHDMDVNDAGRDIIVNNNHYHYHYHLHNPQDTLRAYVAGAVTTAGIGLF